MREKRFLASIVYLLSMPNSRQTSKKVKNVSSCTRSSEEGALAAREEGILAFVVYLLLMPRLAPHPQESERCELLHQKRWNFCFWAKSDRRVGGISICSGWSREHWTRDRGI